MSYRDPLGREIIRQKKEAWRAAAEATRRLVPDSAPGPAPLAGDAALAAVFPELARDGYAVRAGDACERLAELPEGSVHLAATSPPYFQLRSYATGEEAKPKELGSEKTVAEFVENLVRVGEGVRRALRDDGLFFVNLGDTYNTNVGGDTSRGEKRPARGEKRPAGDRFTVGGSLNRRAPSYVKGTGRGRDPIAKPKSLLGIPWRVAFAMEAAGWYLRKEIIWAKCLSGGAWVYAKTQKRDMPVMVKDLVRLDPATVKLWNGQKWTQARAWTESENVGDPIELVLRSGERIGCTRDHVWPTSRGNVRTDGLREGDTIATTAIPEPPDAKCPGFLTDDVAWFLGLYLAEGSRADDTVQLSLHADEARWLGRLREVAAHLGGTLTHTLAGNGLDVRMYGKMIVAAVESYVGGHVAKDKHLSARAWELPNALLRTIVAGYLDGDGSDEGARWRLGFTRNYALERDLRTLAARLGASIRLKPCVVTNQDGEHEAFRGEWRWTRSGHHSEKDSGEVMEIRASRARGFWDITVQDEPHLFALASGVLTHNCNPMPESVMDRPTSSHEHVFMFAKSTRNFWDKEAVREKGTIPAGTLGAKGSAERQGVAGVNARPPEYKVYDGRRNLRDVWWIQTKPFKGAHFATFPSELVAPMILGGTSAAGVCVACGTPRRRVTELVGVIPTSGTFGSTNSTNNPLARAGFGERPERGSKGMRPIPQKGMKGGYSGIPIRETLAWDPGCGASKKCPRCKGSCTIKVPKDLPEVAPRQPAMGDWPEESRPIIGPIFQPPPEPDAMGNGREECPRCMGYGEIRKGCTAEKPVPALVLDPFLGSGTTVREALRLGRRGVGFDLSEKYLEDYARPSIAAVARQPGLLGIG